MISYERVWRDETAVIRCDNCGNKISEGENEESARWNAEDPSETIQVKKTDKITHAVSIVVMDFCTSGCKAEMLQDLPTHKL